MFNYNFVYAAEVRIASGLVALVFALLIVGNSVLARIFLKTAITPRFAAGAAIGIAGLGLVFVNDLASPGAASATAVGVLLSLGAVLSASIANVMQASRLARTLPAMPTLALAMLYGAGLDAAYALLVDGPPVFDPSPAYWAGLLYLAIIASVVAFTLYYEMIRTIGRARQRIPASSSRSWR